MKKMLRLRKTLSLRFNNACLLKTVASEALSKDDYGEVQYPKINVPQEEKNVVPEGWHNHNITVEEKQIKMNMPKYYGYKTVLLNGENFPYNCLPLTQHYTRTYFEEFDKLPEVYNTKQDIDKFAELMEPAIKESLEFSAVLLKKCSTDMLPKEQDDMLGQIIVTQINRLLMNCMAADCTHLSEAEIDFDPRHEAFWFVADVNPPKSVEKSRKNRPWLKDSTETVIRAVQYIGRPYLTLRHRLPLKNIKIDAEKLQDNSEIPLFKYDSRVIGYPCTHRHGTNIPGFWPGSLNELGFLSYQRRSHLLLRRDSYGAEDFQEALHAQGIQSSFGWLFAQSNFLGFTCYNDLIYPMTAQNIITNGKYWSFYIYQMNTLEMQSKYNSGNKINNCWGTKELKLYEEINERGECVGFNSEVLKYLINFYANAPIETNDNMKAYLLQNKQKASDIEDENRRQFVEKIYKHIMSNRPRHLSIPEIYSWEKIYKIDNKTRPMEPRRRFFELGVNPFKRKLDEHTPEYIPKCVRPEGPKSKSKWKKTYYP